MFRQVRSALSTLVLSVLSVLSTARAASLDLSTATIADLQSAMSAGALTAEQLVSLYLARIEAYDKKGPALNTVITLNPRALDEARALDAERKTKGPRGPLHGIAVLAKDVFDTNDLPTTGGFAPMATSQPDRDAFVIERLRAAGAIILGKLNLADWYGIAKSGGSSLLGPVRSPYNPKKYSGGSSSGTGAAMAAWFSSVGLGSDTGGSIVIPSTLNNLVGFAATHGLVSRRGMMWSSPMQDNGGPMGRSVYDCAAVLDVIAGFDAGDLSTIASLGRIPTQPYTSFVSADGLKGARVGVLREMIRSGPLHDEGNALFTQALADFKKAGAVVVDPVRTGLDLVNAHVDASTSAIERAVAVDQYLAGLPASVPFRSLDEMVAKAGNLVEPSTVRAAKESRTLDRHPALLAAIRQKEMLRAALTALMDDYQLDALILPYRTTAAQDLAAVPAGAAMRRETRNGLHAYTGLPTLIVPGGFFASDGMPLGIEFIGRPFTEPTLIKIASGYEAATKHRRSPPSTPALPGETISF